METSLSPLLLASNSPRRRQLLALTGLAYDLSVSNIDESLLPHEEPAAYVRRLAVEKASAALPRAGAHQLVVGADTAVVIDGDVLGKPAHAAEAREMLLRLRGRTHQVFTGIAVLRAADGNLWSDVVVTDVPMRAYDLDEMERYIASGDPLDKAGAYGIQHPGFQPVASMSGCYASVMGLPLCSLSLLLRSAGEPSSPDLPSGCQATLQYQCPAYPAILQGRPANQGE